MNAKEMITGKLYRTYYDKVSEECPDLDDGDYSWDRGYDNFIAHSLAWIVTECERIADSTGSNWLIEVAYEHYVKEAQEDALREAIDLVKTDRDGTW